MICIKITFKGTTRQDKDANKLLVELQYECYVEMAKKETLKICNELREECPEIMHIAVHHRLGLDSFLNSCSQFQCINVTSDNLTKDFVRTTPFL